MAQRVFGTMVDGNRGPRCELPYATRNFIIGRLNSGVSVREVAKQVNCSPSTITRTKQRFATTGTVQSRHRSGAPRKLTEADERLLLRYIREKPKIKP